MSRGRRVPSDPSSRSAREKHSYAEERESTYLPVLPNHAIECGQYPLYREVLYRELKSRGWSCANSSTPDSIMRSKATLKSPYSCPFSFFFLNPTIPATNTDKQRSMPQRQVYLL